MSVVMSGILLLGLAVSAAEPPPPPIINGAVEAGFEETVGLGVALGDEALLVCTGTLITPRMILSAAHCGDKYPIEAIVAVGSAFFGTDSAAPDAVLRFEDAALHPDYVRLENGVTLGENDIAVLILEEDAPFEPAWLPREALTEEGTVGETVVSVGFGLNESGRSDGQKRSAELTVDSLDEVFLRSRVLTNPERASICSGDSGGPQFFLDDAGRHVVWGVHSWADVNCRTESGSTRVDVDGVSQWLLDQVEATHGTTDLCGPATE